MTIYPKDIIGQLSFHVYLATSNIITVYHVMNKSRQQSNKHLVLKSRVCRHDRTYHNNDKELNFESDSDEVTETY